MFRKERHSHARTAWFFGGCLPVWIMEAIFVPNARPGSRADYDLEEDSLDEARQAAHIYLLD